MTVKLYYLLGSPPARAVLLILKKLGIPHELQTVDLLNRGQMSDEYLKLNPQHTVPTLVDEDGFVVADSHAINIYLINKYGKDDSLYPKELKAKSVVDNRLFFDCGVLFPILRNIGIAYFYEKSITGLTKAYVNPIYDAYQTLERFLSSTKYIAGDQVTIADYSILTTLTNLNLFVPITKETYPKLAAYIECSNSTIPDIEELNKSAADVMKNVYYKDFNFQIS